MKSSLLKVVSTVHCYFTFAYLGEYLPLHDIEKTTQTRSVKVGHIFEKPTNPDLVSAGINRDWPHARGAWQNIDQDVVVWLNEEEHIKIAATEKGGDIVRTFKLFCSALEHLELELNVLDYKFAWNEHLGYVVADLKNIGK